MATSSVNSNHDNHVIVFGRNSKNRDETIQALLSETGQWRLIAEKRMKAWGDLSYAVFDNDKLIISGYYPDDDDPKPPAEDVVKCLHLKSMRLTSDLPKLNQGRFGHQTAVIGRDLYVVGGSPDKFEGLELNTAEKLSYKSNAWKYISPMQYERQHFHLLSANGCLYAFGGYNVETKIIERYDPSKNSWSTVSPLRFDDCNGAAAQGKFIYVLLKRTHNDREIVLDKYDCTTDTWEMIAKLTTAPFTTVQMCLRGSLLFAVEDSPSRENKTNALHIFNFDSLQWSLGSSVKNMSYIDYIFVASNEYNASLCSE